MINTVLLIVMHVVRKWSLGSFMSQYLVRLRRQELFPFVVGLDDFDDRADVDLLWHDNLPGNSVLDARAWHRGIRIDRGARRPARPQCSFSHYKAVDTWCSVGRA